MISPAAQEVHPRRHRDVFSSQVLDGFDTHVPAKEYYRGVFEKKYGYPTDIDAVWADRAAEGKAGC